MSAKIITLPVIRIERYDDESEEKEAMAHGELKMTKDEMARGLAAGRTLTQEEWAHPSERAWVDELVAAGSAIATPWKYRDNFQCEVSYIKASNPSSADTK
jgi:hypothetical protein